MAVSGRMVEGVAEGGGGRGLPLRAGVRREEREERRLRMYCSNWCSWWRVSEEEMMCVSYTNLFLVFLPESVLGLFHPLLTFLLLHVALLYPCLQLLHPLKHTYSAPVVQLGRSS